MTICAVPGFRTGSGQPSDSEVRGENGVTYLDLRTDVEESEVPGYEMVSNASGFILLNGVR